MSDTPSVRGPAEGTDAGSLTELNARRRGPLRRFFRRHPRAMDAVVVLAYLVIALPDAIVLAASSGNWLGLTGVILAAGALAVRRDRPLTVLTVVALLDPPVTLLAGGAVSISAAVLAALYTVAAAYPLGKTLAAAASATILTVGAIFLGPSERFEEAPGIIFLLIGFLVMLSAVAVGIGVTVRRDREHEQEVRRWAARNAELASAEERNRIAREMHDVIAHSLTVMVALADGAAVVMKRDPDRALAVLGELSSTGRAATADMRRVLGVLRLEAQAGSLEPLPASGSLTQLFDGFRAAGLPLRVTSSGPGLPEDPAFQLTVYRIIQESLTNVLRYGKSVTAVDVSIARAGDRVALRISDDGRGAMDPAVSLGSSRGVAGMRERAAIYSGTAESGARPSGGWVVEAQLIVPDTGDGAGHQERKGNNDDEPHHAGRTRSGPARR
ncbi:sensor histidine kinase [Arthrobacter sp. MSA 4-2]|uniref:sensor histidine kinase n=1 Tax=Arthrobacter sp. MSA 4-2 TaxID=2794349 RepID=UPI0018E768B4|nr:histidine kinase [Arthrobacter sp. MSA 4-2]MBJ2122564.1 sensor histidine kinase [Arthrobacter sp. MSA 4-2]